MASNGNISHAEMWDDSVLVNSWNDALEEYKKYHSIQALGQDVNDVLKTAEAASALGSTDEQPQSDIHDRQAKKEVIEVEADHGKASSPSQTQVNNVQSAQFSSNPPALPQHLVGQVHDEGLKNLLMSWYYAGYYTGLYEGQKKE